MTNSFLSPIYLKFKTQLNVFIKQFCLQFRHFKITRRHIAFKRFPESFELAFCVLFPFFNKIKVIFFIFAHRIWGSISRSITLEKH